jgi:hypothetical protein
VAVTDDRSAVLLIRVWLDGDDQAFRARLTALGSPDKDGRVEESAVATTASPSVVVAAVEEWLAQFVHRPGGSG